MATNTPEQNVLAIFVEAILYGLYLATLLHCLRWMLYENEGWKIKKRASIPWTMFISTMIIFICSFVNLILHLKSTTLSIHPKPVTPSTPKMNWEATAICATANVTALTADLILIYRCWIVYSRSRKVVIFPIFLWVGGLVCAIIQAYWQIVQTQVVITAWQPAAMKVGLGTILTPFWGSTVALNLYTTSMIVYRIWTAAHESIGTDSLREFKFIIRVITESGVLYLAIIIAHFVVWFTPNAFAIVMVSNMNLPIIGIAFNLILIRTSKRRADDLKEMNRDLVSDLEFNAVPPVGSMKFTIEQSMYRSRAESTSTS
ncbi:hypothetical protein BDQ12DRAFT_727404 [Crucibulum laeve]|uniref:G-protein coupled receptors family 1 profile domain-containing protein n=1 Tax=Crucibulum laeve TaxID=68775 RepID=A0A5C3LL68_9AGAR|nr:hypothetical protein BDQ12DRAFT_727404 [Crucibulum laeve]